eukprot:COSAG02_NODE_5470_length_4297_cov_1.497141_6_plen_264_part_00
MYRYLTSYMLGYNVTTGFEGLHPRPRTCGRDDRAGLRVLAAVAWRWPTPPTSRMPAAARSRRKSSGAAVQRPAVQRPAAAGAAQRAIRKPSAASRGGDDGLSALLSGLSIGSRPSGKFWTPILVEYFASVSAIRADADALFASVGRLAEQHARVVSGAGEPATEMTEVGRADDAVARSASALESACALALARTDARLAELDGDESCVEMRIRRNIDGSLIRRVELCLETLREARQQYAAEMTKEGWRPPADGSTLWTYEPSHG